MWACSGSAAVPTAVPVLRDGSPRQREPLAKEEKTAAALPPGAAVVPLQWSSNSPNGSQEEETIKGGFLPPSSLRL